MIRLSPLLWLALVAATGFATFKVKYAVQDTEEELNRARRQTIAEQQETHVLRAEWTSLNQPERLADLNRRLLSLAAVAPKQLQRGIEDIPLRAAASAPPDTLPDNLIAASPEAPPPPAPAEAPASAVAAAPAALKPTPLKPAPRVQLAKATVPVRQLHSIDQLFSEIAETR